MNQNVLTKESELLLDCLDFDILIIDDKFNVLFANNAILNKIGMNKDEAVKKHCYEITHHLKRQCQPPDDPCPIDTVIRTKNPSVELHTHYTKQKQEFKANVIAAPILLDNRTNIYLHIALPVEGDIDREDDIKQATIKTLDILQVIRSYQDKVAQLEKAKKELNAKMAEINEISQYLLGKEINFDELKNKINQLKGD